MPSTDPTDRGAQDQTANRGTHLDRLAVIRSIDYGAGSGSGDDSSDDSGGDSSDSALPGPTATLRYARSESDATDLENVPVMPSVLGETPPLTENDPVIVRWLAGNPPRPYIAGSFYNEEDNAPASDGELSWNIGGSRIEMLPNGDINIDAAGLITITDSEGTLTTSDGSSDGTRTVEQPTWGEGSDMPDDGRGDPP